MTNIVLDIEEPAANPKKRRSLKYLILATPFYLIYFFLGDFVAKLYAIHKEKFYIFVMVTIAESILLPGYSLLNFSYLILTNFRSISSYNLLWNENLSMDSPYFDNVSNNLRFVALFYDFRKILRIFLRNTFFSTNAQLAGYSGGAVRLGVPLFEFS